MQILFSQKKPYNLKYIYLQHTSRICILVADSRCLPPILVLYCTIYSSSSAVIASPGAIHQLAFCAVMHQLPEQWCSSDITYCCNSSPTSAILHLLLKIFTYCCNSSPTSEITHLLLQVLT